MGLLIEADLRYFARNVKVGVLVVAGFLGADIWSGLKWLDPPSPKSTTNTTCTWVREGESAIGALTRKTKNQLGIPSPSVDNKPEPLSNSNVEILRANERLILISFEQAEAETIAVFPGDLVCVTRYPHLSKKRYVKPEDIMIPEGQERCVEYGVIMPDESVADSTFLLRRDAALKPMWLFPNRRSQLDWFKEYGKIEVWNEGNVEVIDELEAFFRGYNKFHPKDRICKWPILKTQQVDRATDRWTLEINRIREMLLVGKT